MQENNSRSNYQRHSYNNNYQRNGYRNRNGYQGDNQQQNQEQNDQTNYFAPASTQNNFSSNYRRNNNYRQDRDARFSGGFQNRNKKQNRNNDWARLAPQLIPSSEAELYAEADKLDPTKIEYAFYDMPVQVQHGPSQPDIQPYLEFSQFLSSSPQYLQDAIKRLKYQKLTPIQQYSIPISMQGYDVISLAQTGSGKTTAFTYPVLVGIQNLSLKSLTNSPTSYKTSNSSLSMQGKPFCIVLSPTRELAVQNVRSIWQLSHNSGILARVCYGGESQTFQSKIIRSGCDILVATTGRLKDFIDHGVVDLRYVKYFILDEADNMCDMGFLPDINYIKDKINEARKTRTEQEELKIGELQSMMFSATFPKEIRQVAEQHLNNPYKIIVGKIGITGKNITQILLKTTVATKLDFLKYLCTKQGSILIFCKTKSNVDTVVNELRQAFTSKTAENVADEIKNQINQMFQYMKNRLEKEAKDNDLSEQTTEYFKDVSEADKLGYFSVAGIHGDLSQQQRTENLANFRNKTLKILVATDVAQRGLDIPNVDYVINYDLPATIDDYCHRIGRTGRAGKRGSSLTLVTEVENKSIMRDLRTKLVECDQLLPKWYDDMLRTQWTEDRGYGSRFGRNNRDGNYNRGRGNYNRQNSYNRNDNHNRY